MFWVCSGETNIPQFYASSTSKFIGVESLLGFLLKNKL